VTPNRTELDLGLEPEAAPGAGPLDGRGDGAGDEGVDSRARRSSGELAALHIRRMIFDGALRPGDRVPQDDVARDLGISRIPVREGLIALEREGWVTIELHRGAFVSAFDEPSVRDHYEMFGLVYGFAVVRAVARGGDELAPALTALQHEIAATDDPAVIWRPALRFHALVVDAARSPRIKVVLRSMPTLIPGNFFERVPGAIAVEHRGSAAVARAVRRGDGDAAVAAYARTMGQQGDLVVKVLRDRGLL
jgi:DNA-binding GntR family transcriptional regulator